MSLRHILTSLSLLIATASTGHAQNIYICHDADVETASELNFSDGGYTLNDEFDTEDIDSITFNVPAMQFVGGDLSLLSKYESQGAKFKDEDGQVIDDVLYFVKEQGWNTIRVRLMVDPKNIDDLQKHIDDPNELNAKLNNHLQQVVQDLEYVTSLGRRIKAAGMLFMLDFHYSDTWADPSNQWTPADWAALNEEQLQMRIYEYTRDCLQTLCEAEAAPDFIQVGNEISYGMLWGTKAAVGNKGNTTNRCFSTSNDANWNRFFNLLRQAGKACREVCPRAKIIIHSERTPKPSVLTDYFDRIKRAGIDYDIIGLSFYPYFHGGLNTLNTAIRLLENKNYGKWIQVVETGYPSQWEVQGTTVDNTATWPYSWDGQKKYVNDLIDMLKQHPQVNGLSWWYAETSANSCNGDLKNGWYNAGLFDNSTGKALPALYELQRFK